MAHIQVEKSRCKRRLRDVFATSLLYMRHILSSNPPTTDFLVAADIEYSAVPKKREDSEVYVGMQNK
jgi:hypothetical protein